MDAYVSTRGGEPVSLAQAVFRGLAPDGGLYVPVELPRLPSAGRVGASERTDLRPVARWATPWLLPSVPAPVLRRVVDHALDMPVPLVEVEPGLHVLELFHGPTHAFKDIGARFMAALMAELDDGAGPERTVLVATSGDTGGAVATAFHGRAGYRVVVLFPREGISERQRRQMTTLGGNVHALAVDGAFDDCQRMVKAAFTDAATVSRFRLTSANSINVARLLPQALYYLHAVNLLTGWPDATPPDGGGVPATPRFVVPSGNLGNLCAALIAVRAGMPNSGVVAAANENRGFVDLLSGAAFEARPSVSTSSSAMDVGDPSNLERVLWLYGGDVDALRSHVRGEVVSEAETAACIRDVHERTGYLLDPHTAVAYSAALRSGAGRDVPTVVLATAHPAKFPEVVEGATGVEAPLPPGLVATRDRPEHFASIAATVDALHDVLSEDHWENHE
jgi:threonine synthase